VNGSLRAAALGAGKSLSIVAACALSANLILGAEAAKKLPKGPPVTITAGPNWLPLDVSLDVEPGSALDFSTLVPRHAPAGKFGRVVVSPEGKFAFEKRAVPARFYGVDLCCTAQYLPHALADRLADRLVRLGYNAVRIHHHERWLWEPDPGVRWQSDRLDELDYLFAALKRRGIYVTTDLYVSRLVALAEVYPETAEGKRGGTAPAAGAAKQWTFENYYNTGPGNFDVQQYKMAVYVNPRAYEDYKKFSRALLEHKNPYTGLRYADDPALAWISLMNEDCPGNFIAGLNGPLRDDWQRAWNRWLTARHPDRDSLIGAVGVLPDDQDHVRGTVPLATISSTTPLGVAFSMFVADVQRDFVQRTRKFLRDELGCRALLSDCNGWTNPVQLQGVRSDFDYVDDHFYVDHPTYLAPTRVPPSRSANVSPIAGGAPGGRRCAFTRVYGKPLTITEFNYCGPGRYRGTSGLLTGAMGALQDWDGLWRHVYSYSRENIERPAAMYYFDVAADPLTQAAERAGLCLFLRGDLEPAKHAVAIDCMPGDLLASAKTARDRTPPWDGLAWLTRVGWRIGDSSKLTGTDLSLAFGTEGKVFAPGTEKAILETFRLRGWLPAGNRTDFAKNRFQSENGSVTVDSPENMFTLDTARTAGGFAPAGKRIQTRAASIDILDAEATVWVTSLDGRPIADSRRLLITHLTDLQNTGTRFADRSQQALLAWGKLPHLVRAGRANLALRIQDAGRAKVFSLAVSGRRTGEVQAEVGNGTLSIPLSVDAGGKARMLYEVEVGK
jgi:hypothetical protein